MPELTKKNDFIEIEFLGKTDEDIFDTNIPNELKKLNPDAEAKPLVLCIGQEMVVKGFDKALESKELGKKHTIKLQAEQAFGKRNPSLTKLIPKRVFLEHKMNPFPGMTVSLDNNLAKIMSVSGGRIMVDFNNPLAGKDVAYEFTIKKKISDINEKINALQDFFFRKRFEFDVDNQKKKIIFKDLQLTPVLNMFKDQFKNTIGYDVEILAKKEKKL